MIFDVFQYPRNLCLFDLDERRETYVRVAINCKNQA
jgi:hypothetical protein